MSPNSSAFYDAFSGEEYDRLQPLRIEMYRFYHELALDFVPFETDETFRILDLGPGTSVFLESVLDRYPNVSAHAIEYAPNMIDFSLQKLALYKDRICFEQGDLGEGLPDDIGQFDFVSSFSAIHHLSETNKRELYRRIYEVLEPGGWVFS
jgi:tRNA (cmo5U34)-methyltransferase